MSYPEPKAGYKHKPKFLDRMLAKEKESVPKGGDGGMTAGALSGPGRLQKIAMQRDADDMED